MSMKGPLVFHEEWFKLPPPQDHQDPIIVGTTKDEVGPAGSPVIFSSRLSVLFKKINHEEWQRYVQSTVSK